MWLGHVVRMEDDAPSNRDPLVYNRSSSAHAFNERTKCIGIGLNLGCTTGVTSQTIQANSKVWYSRPRLSHGCSAKEEEESEVQTMVDILINYNKNCRV